MENKIIKARLYHIIECLTNNAFKIPFDNIKEKDALNMIFSNSIYATNFLLKIEEDFNFDLDDDEIDIDFFSSVDRIVEIINLHEKINF